MLRQKGQKGAALIFVVVILILLTLLAGYVLSLAYNKKKLDDRIAARHTKAYYLAQAGVVDAEWRIRKNIGGLFTNPTDPATPYHYLLNINTGLIVGVVADSVVDVTITYDSGTQLKKIESKAFLD